MNYKIILTTFLAVCFSLINGQDTLTFVTYKNINQSFTKELSEFNNEYDSENQITFHKDKIVTVDLRVKSDLIPQSSYTHTKYIDEVTVNEHGLLSIKLKGYQGDPTTQYYLIDASRIEHHVYENGKLIYKNIGLFKYEIKNTSVNFFKNNKVLKVEMMEDTFTVIS